MGCFMIRFLQSLQTRWSNWCGDHEMELAIRRHLSTAGYFGNTAKLRAIRLAAVERPGWLQVYRFEATARVARIKTNDDDDSSALNAELMPLENGLLGQNPDAHERSHDDLRVYHDLFGLVREDHRRDQVSVRVFRENAERVALFEQWSSGLLQLRNGRAMR